MKNFIAVCWSLLAVLLLLPTPSQAVESSACSFNPPSAALKPNTYPGQTFRRLKDNQASESAQLSKTVRLDLHRSQCVDGVVTEFVFTVSASAAPTDPLEFVVKEIAQLKLKEPAATVELLTFLKTAQEARSRDHLLSVCRDGSRAPAGECSWDSGGGYTFKVNKTSSSMQISVTEYVSG